MFRPCPWRVSGHQALINMFWGFAWRVDESDEYGGIHTRWCKGFGVEAKINWDLGFF